MSLYKRVDSNAGKTAIENLRNAVPNTGTETIVFVDATEASLNENASRGITGPGWWSYRTYVDSSGKTRHKAEHLVVISNPEANADETQSDDTIVADAASAVTITGQPANATTSSGGATFTVTTSTTGTPGTLTYQWQRQNATGTTWANVTNTGIYTGSTTATLTLTGATNAVGGYKYRVKITSTGGTEEVISNGSATLTFGT
ncbi:hypothetical protein EBS02_08445 [bacterium]|nr:hypothetical protein [bacterium]